MLGGKVRFDCAIYHPARKGSRVQDEPRIECINHIGGGADVICVCMCEDERIELVRAAVTQILPRGFVEVSVRTSVDQPIACRRSDVNRTARADIQCSHIDQRMCRPMRMLEIRVSHWQSG